MNRPGGRGGCWPLPGHRPGWYHLRKRPSTGKHRRPNAPKGCTVQARHGPAGLPSVFPPYSLHRVRWRIRRDRLFRSRMGARRSRSWRKTTPPQDGRNVGGSRKALSVSTLSHIQDKSLRVGGLVDEGWGLQPEREQCPLRKREGLRQHATDIVGKQEQPRCRSCLTSCPSREEAATLAQAGYESVWKAAFVVEA